jgi:hypothetical protein
VSLASALLGFDPAWRIIFNAHKWFVGRQPGGFNRTFPLRLLVSSLFVIFLLWVLRKDLRALWVGRFGKTAGKDFESIAILPTIGEDKRKVRKHSRNRFLIPFRLSAKPPKEWARMFRKIWKGINQKNVELKERELRLVCTATEVETIFPKLKKAVDTTNDQYRASVEQARERLEKKKREAERKINAKRAQERSVRSDIDSTLDKLNSPRVN